MMKFLLFSTALACVTVVILHIAFPLPDKVEYSTIITDSRGRVLHAYLTSDDKWRIRASLNEISPLLQTTIIEKEDKYFFYHAGVNPISVLRAVINNILHLRRTSGASTITMQVARALEPKSRNYGNKLIEIFRAFQLELKYSKKEILRLYCNLLPYGGNIEGVKSASLLYFQKDPDHLSLAQIVALCVIPNRPSSLIPGRHNDRIVKERNRWLSRFNQQQVFSFDQINDALTEPFNARRHSFPKYVPHLAQKLRKQSIPLIETAIEMNLQTKTEKIVSDYVRTLHRKNIRNAAVVIIDNKNHNVVTYVGSANFDDTIDGGQVDGASAIRQPGSTLKPLIYGMSIDEGYLTPRTVMNDVMVSYDGYSPENYDKLFNGAVTMEYALSHSLNIPAVRALRTLGHDDFITTLSACNFRQIRKDNKKLGLSVALGGCGTTLLELTGLYSAFANGGKFVAPRLYRDDTYRPGFQVISTAAAYMINQTLSKTARPDFPISWSSTSRMPRIAWKTGTSYGRRDAWSIGYNKRYTVGVWVGNFSAQGIPELSGAETATPLLFRIFNTIDYDTDQEWFSRPDDCKTRMVCPETGLPPGAFCGNVVPDDFLPGISSAKTCEHLRQVAVSADEAYSYCKTCLPPAGYRKRFYRVVAPEMQAWYADNRLSYQHMPPHNPECEKVFRESGPLLVSPRAGTEYLIDKNDPEPLQLLCRTGNDVSTVHWYVNDRYYRTAFAGTPVLFVPAEGDNKISCTDDKGRNRSIWIKVKYVNI